MTSISVKTPYYSPWFCPKTEKFDFAKKLYDRKGHLKRSFVAPSTVEYIYIVGCVAKEALLTSLYEREGRGWERTRQ